MTRHLTILIAILLAALGLKAQTKVYPVQVTISGSGDISAELSELYGARSTLMFTFQCLDRGETSLPVAVKVRLYPSTGHGKAIENKLQTGKKTFDIGFGQTIIEQKGELDKYFLNEYTNLSQAGYYQNGQLAEGNYILQVTCYDARTITRQISNTAKMYLHIDQFGYPTLLQPRSGTDLEQYTTKPAISFQWTYYGKTDPRIRYRFELWEVINATTVETYVKQNKPIFSEENLFVTQKSYMPELLQLQIGHKYCWRVTAYDPDGKLPFKRGGESDVYQFQYLNPPVPVTGLASKVTGKQIKYSWNSDRNHTNYYVEYYDYKRDTVITSSQKDNNVLLTAPEYDYRIKFRVRAESYGDPSRVSDYTPWSEAYVQPEKKIEYECGKQFPEREITNQELKTTFFEGEIVESKNGDSRYEIIKATARPDGSLDGKFYAIMDCWSGAKILCDFWDTKINTDNIILTTRYRSEDIPGFVADPEEIKKYVHELVNNAHMAATDNKIRDTILINQKFDYLYAENGRLKAVVVDKNGEPQVTDVTPDKPYSQSLITDGQGDTLVVSKKGQVMGVKEYKFAGDDRHLLNEYHRQLDSLGEWQINFTPAKNQTYAFDQIGSGNHGIFATDEYYPKSGSYDFRYKSVESGKRDRVVVDFGSYPEKDSVIFKDKYGVKLKVVDGNILAFTGVSKADTNYIYAYRGDKKIGKLFLNTYQKKTYKVVLVSVNGAGLPDIGTLETYLNKVYNQCAVKFEISIEEFDLRDLTSFSHGGSGILTVYNDDQKKVLQAYEKEKKMKDGVFYLFFIDSVTDKKDGSGTPVSGYMPRGYNCGFIYDGGSPHTIAHELGHGIAGLEHVFENSNASGKTSNLMDYANGEELWHFQWDQIQDPSRVWMKWNKDEREGELSHATCVAMSDDLKKIRVFILSDGTRIKLPDNFTAAGFVWSGANNFANTTGTLAAINDGNYDYVLNSDKECNYFGYKDDLGTFYPKYAITDEMRVFETAASVKQSDKTFEISWNDIKVVSGTRLCIFPENDIYKTLYTEMSDEDYQEAVKGLVKRLEENVTNQKFLAVDGSADDSNEAKDYRDRFEVFNSETGNSIYVDVCCFNKKPTAEQISKMAQDVFEQSNLKDDDKSKLIYLVLPVWNVHKITNNLRQYDKQIFARSLYTNNPQYSGIRETSDYKSITGNPIEVIDKIYRLVPKPHISISYFVTCEGNIVRGIGNDNQNVTGYPFIYDFNLWYDKALSTFADLTLKINSYRQHIQGYTTPQSRNNYYTVNDLAKSIERREELVNKETIDTMRVNHGIKQSALKLDDNDRCKTAEDFVIWFVKHKFGRSYSLDDDIFVIGKNQVEYDETLKSIDALGVLLMPAKLDFVADAIGCIYTGYYGEWSDVALYSVGFVAIGVSGGIVRKVFSKKSKIVWESNNSVKIVDQVENAMVKPIADISGPEKMMNNILSDVRGKRIIGNVEMDYDDLFREYFKHLDAETLAKFDKQMLNSWHAMMQKEMPEAWCRDITIVERFNNPEEKLFQCWNDLQSYTNKPEILLKDFDKFAEFKKKMSYTFKRMNELNAPTHWLVDYDYIKEFNKHHERGCEFLQALSDNKIIIDDFDSFMLFVEYANKYSVKRVNPISFANLGQTMYYADRKYTEKVIQEYTRILKNNPNLPVDKFRAMIGDFEHIDNFSNFTVRDIENLCGYVHETEVRKLLEHTTLKVRSSGKYLAKDKIQAFVAGCMSTAASKFILWRCKEANMYKDWSEFFNEITTKINDPESYAFDFWGDMLKDGLANTVTKKRPILGCLTNTDYSKIYLGIKNDKLTSSLLKEALNCVVGWVIDKAKNSDFVKEEMLTIVFNGGAKMKLWTQPLENLITDTIKDLEY